ncbi:MAG: YggS family pyridoxal phosphate-dependent enzyme [Bacteroidaceae bacterium]|nr:YggS family pyridoxal phosphate-dependent enzyme [Bacteroidaceae bacterium]
MPDIRSNIERIRATLPSGVTLIAVSKYHPVEAIAKAYSVGERHFGESKAQDLRLKHQALPQDIKWHFIGHLQSNKIKYIASFVHLIHSVDTLRLLQEINRHAANADRIIPCLLQIHIAQEDTKFGFTTDECRAMLDEGTWRTLKNIQIRGLMCMASNTDNTTQIREEFEAVKALFDEIKQKHFGNDDSFDTFSAGMSDDYTIAIEAGSTHIRIGSDIFAQ